MTWKPRRVFVPFQFQYKEKRKQEGKTMGDWHFDTDPIQRKQEEKTMDAKTYQECALRTMADQQKILDRLVELGPLAMQLDNGARGLADDAGEVSGVIKKHIEYGQPLDVEHLIEELGDCFWRMLQICDAAGITFEQIWQANYDKLNKVRYKDGYSDDAAKEENRDREKERQAMEYKQTIQEIQNEETVQNGQGWAEPPEIDWNQVDEVTETLLKPVKIVVEEGEAKIENSVLRRKPLGHSYTRYCKVCQRAPVHKANQLCICMDCYMKYGETKETANDTATTG